MDGQIALDGLRASQAAAGHAWASAHAAWWIGSAALILNGVGIYFLRKQIIENTAAINASARSAEAATEAVRLARLETRPWLKASVPQFVGAQLTPSGDGLSLAFDFTITVENIGRTPALMVGATARVFEGHPVEDVDQFLKSFANGGIRTNQAIFPGEQKPMQFKMKAAISAVEFANAVRVICAVMVTYKDRPDGEVFTTPVVLSVSNPDASDPPAFRIFNPAHFTSAVELVPFVMHDSSPT